MNPCSKACSTLLSLRLHGFFASIYISDDKKSLETHCSWFNHWLSILTDDQTLSFLDHENCLGNFFYSVKWLCKTNITIPTLQLNKVDTFHLLKKLCLTVNYSTNLEGQNLHQELQKVNEKMTKMSMFFISIKQQQHIYILPIYLTTKWETIKYNSNKAQFQIILMRSTKGFRLSNLMIINLIWTNFREIHHPKDKNMNFDNKQNKTCNV